jgi:hypothetical protein
MVDPARDGEVALQVDAPFDLGDEFNPHFTEVVTLDSVANVNGPNYVQQIGQRLVDILHKNHTIREVLRTVLMLPSAPIYFRVGDPRAHRLSWEALYRNQTFLALDARWPIARLPRAGKTIDTTRRDFAAPLVLVCVLSAVGVDALPEWNGIYDAVQTARQRVPISVTLLAGQETVLDAARARQPNDSNLTVLPVPSASEIRTLIDTIRLLKPHILHMFCHGRIDEGGVNMLDVATITDFEAGAGLSSIQIRAQELGEALKNPQSWSVVLNTCGGADASTALTHAEKIVNAGVPVAVGMRRQIDAGDACAFSAAFYPRVFDAVATATESSARSREINWADTLLGARCRLRDMHGSDPSTDDSWTIPVLYTRSRAFRINVVAPGTANQEMKRSSETNVVEGLVEIIGESAPPSVIDDLRSTSGV